MFIILSVSFGVWILTLVPISHVVVVIMFIFRIVLNVIDDSIPPLLVQLCRHCWCRYLARYSVTRVSNKR